MLMPRNSIHMALAGAIVVVLAGCAAPPSKQVVTEVDEPIDFTKRARLVDGKEGARLIFPDGLLFDFGKYALKGEAEKNLDACKFIIERARGKVLVEGHTDSQGSKAINEPLSKSRADAVRTALIERRIAPSRIEVRGLADSKPEVPNATTDEQHAQNRRAEVIFVGESVASLNAPFGCGGPPAKRRVVTEVKEEPNALQKLGKDLRDTVEKVTGK